MKKNKLIIHCFLLCFCWKLSFASIDDDAAWLDAALNRHSPIYDSAAREAREHLIEVERTIKNCRASPWPVYRPDSLDQLYKLSQTSPIEFSRQEKSLLRKIANARVCEPEESFTPQKIPQPEPVAADLATEVVAPSPPVPPKKRKLEIDLDCSAEKFEECMTLAHQAFFEQSELQKEYNHATQKYKSAISQRLETLQHMLDQSEYERYLTRIKISRTDCLPVNEYNRLIDENQELLLKKGKANVQEELVNELKHSERLIAKLTDVYQNQENLYRQYKRLNRRHCHSKAPVFSFNGNHYEVVDYVPGTYSVKITGSYDEDVGDQYSKTYTQNVNIVRSSETLDFWTCRDLETMTPGIRHLFRVSVAGTTQDPLIRIATTANTIYGTRSYFLNSDFKFSDAALHTPLVIYLRPIAEK